MVKKLSLCPLSLWLASGIQLTFTNLQILLAQYSQPLAADGPDEDGTTYVVVFLVSIAFTCLYALFVGNQGIKTGFFFGLIYGRGGDSHGLRHLFLHAHPLSYGLYLVPGVRGGIHNRWSDRGCDLREEITTTLIFEPARKLRLTGLPEFPIREGAVLFET